ncbi:lipocalin family protein [Spirosoma sp. KUDC1026]|uniref:lipocalin family protein n=1 Tax=Spirosoma sp. KUDC1026 TaxID=2745947 RepID=UPI00159BC42E|nr:lipocalin family protein [Spirosoma sp. KUDC1026]QKZ14695.1 lipocalin family protein [Spirosoma sp. KUDC1026]
MIRFTTTRLTLWVLLLTMPLFVSSCKKGNDDVTPATVEGNWKLTGLKFSPALDTGIFGEIGDYYQWLLDFGAGDCLNSLVFTFNSNGSTSLNNPPACQDATDDLDNTVPIDDSSKWVLDGNKLTLTNGDGTTVTYDVTINGNTMTWSAPQEYEKLDGSKATTTATMTLTRV